MKIQLQRHISCLEQYLSYLLIALVSLCVFFTPYSLKQELEMQEWTSEAIPE